MKFTYLTLFENLISFYFQDSILKRAIENNIIEYECINPRDFTPYKYNKVDDYMIGGGAGLLMQASPIENALKHALKNTSSHHIIYLSPAGKKFNQNDAKRLASKDSICFICGRYEGIDERIVEKYVNEVFCIGDFILTGGELPALCISDAISRNIKGVLGNPNSLEIESFESNLLEAPSFAKPIVFDGIPIPSDFLKGNHGKIQILKNTMAKYKTRFFRPDLHNKLNRQHKGKK